MFKGELPINIDSLTRSKIENVFENPNGNGSDSENLFEIGKKIEWGTWDRAADAVFKLMTFDSFTRFKYPFSFFLKLLLLFAV